MEGVSSESSRDRQDGRAGGRKAALLRVLTLLLRGNGGQVVAEQNTAGNREELNNLKPQTASSASSRRGHGNSL